jgi:integrase
MAKILITDRTLKSLKPASKRYAKMDLHTAGFGVRVSEQGKRTFVLRTRYPGGAGNATWRALGEYPAMTLEEAREKAAHWLKLIGRHEDPAAVEERQRQAAQRKRANSFAAVVEDFIRESIIGHDPENPRQRRGAKVARELRDFFVPLWGDRPITEITRADIQAAIIGIRDHGGRGMLAAAGIKGAKRPAKGKRAPGQARNLLGNLKALFAWTIEFGGYGIEANPARDVRAKTLVGVKPKRDRDLSDLEIAALWRATERLKYPHREIYQLLLLTGLRRDEVREASWPEIKGNLWTIPASRMKGTNELARKHTVPLTKQMLAILDSLPDFKDGKFLFSKTVGIKPVSVDDKIKKTIDTYMREELPDLAPWVNHDLRRTIRTGMSKLRVDRDVRESILSHARPGVEGRYDVYDPIPEKLDAFERWGKRVRELVRPPPDNVTDISKARAKARA